MCEATTATATTTTTDDVLKKKSKICDKSEFEAAGIKLFVLFEFTKPRKHFKDLDKLNSVMLVCFTLKPLFDTAPAASKNDFRFKDG